MKKVFLLLFFLTTYTWTHAQILYEDFEGGVADVSWVALNGTYNGVVANPAPDGVNGSAFVGSYTNNEAFDYNFALGTLGAPADLSKFNLIKMKVWSPIAPSQVLFKFEGVGEAVEFVRDITTANEWVEYSFDLTGGACMLSLNKILIAFDRGVLGSFETF